MSDLQPGDRVYATGPYLAQMREYMRATTGTEPNHHGTIERVAGDRVLIVFDDGQAAPYPADEVRHLNQEVSDRGTTER
ncbi:hypothetical protein ACQFYA_21085 [Promicromonospora sp. Marseille-Q5078]